MQVLVRDNNIEQALRVLKKKMQREGVFREMKRASFYDMRQAMGCLPTPTTRIALMLEPNDDGRTVKYDIADTN